MQMLEWFRAEAALRFTLEAGESLWIGGHFLRQKLERDETVKTSVFGLVNHTHAAAAEFLENAVVRNGLADHRANLTCMKRNRSTKAGDQ